MRYRISDKVVSCKVTRHTTCPACGLSVVIVFRSDVDRYELLHEQPLCEKFPSAVAAVQEGFGE